MSRLRQRISSAGLDALAGLAGGALVVALLVLASPLVALGSTSAPALAQKLVSNEAQLRAAFANRAVSQVTLGADVALSDCARGQLERPAGSHALTLDGRRHTIRQTCKGARVLSNRGGALTLRKVTITGGSLDAGPNAGAGGGVFSATPLRLVEATVSGNRADGELGGRGGGIAALSTVTIVDSAVTGNHAGGGRSIFGGQGAGVSADGRLSVIRSTVADNVAEGAVDAGGQAGGMIARATTSIVRSTLSGNRSAAGRDRGSGLMAAVVVDADLDVVNSTVSGNVALGPQSVDGGIGASGKLRLVYSTVTLNSAATGSANVSFKPSDAAYASVVSEPLGGARNCRAPVGTSAGYDFSDDASCGFVNSAHGDRQSAGSPGLGPLRDNGGIRLTRLPSATSPLVDAISSARCRNGVAAGVSTDERGVRRPRGRGCDIGSVER
jgi:fibronectin-binding autotransporter adhesin